MLGAAHAMQQVAAWNPKSMTFEALAHTGPAPLKKVFEGTAVFKDPRYRVVRRPRRKKKP